METNEDTLLERIRKLEQTVEQIESGSIAIAAAPTGQPAVQAAAPVRRAELPKAVPEEIKEIVAKCTATDEVVSQKCALKPWR